MLVEPKPIPNASSISVKGHQPTKPNKKTPTSHRTSAGDTSSVHNSYTEKPSTSSHFKTHKRTNSSSLPKKHLDTSKSLLLPGLEHEQSSEAVSSILDRDLSDLHHKYTRQKNKENDRNPQRPFFPTQQKTNSYMTS